MAYYTKKEILEYVDSNIQSWSEEDKKIEPLNPRDEILMRLEGEEDMAAFFWLDFNEESEGAKMKMNGKAFVRIDHDLYTDDRFALDAYQAAKEGVLVSDVIKKRNDEAKVARERLKNKEEFESKIENIKKDGA